jgi:DNA-binding transcriptional MerR regulator
LQDQVGKLLDRLDKDMKSLGLKNEEVDRLLKRARQDEDDGLYDDALKNWTRCWICWTSWSGSSATSRRRSGRLEEQDRLFAQPVRTARRRINAKRQERDRQQTRNDPPTMQSGGGWRSRTAGSGMPSTSGTDRRMGGRTARRRPQ